MEKTENFENHPLKGEFGKEKEQIMKLTVAVEGMMCMHCEARVNKAVKKAFEGAEVSSSHLAGQTVVVSESPIDGEALMNVIREAGYKATSVKVEA